MNDLTKTIFLIIGAGAITIGLLLLIKPRTFWGLTKFSHSVSGIMNAIPTKLYDFIKRFQALVYILLGIVLIFLALR
jgi:hypothetical protein